MGIAPTLISYNEPTGANGPWTAGDGLAAKVTASISWQINDVVVSISGSEGQTSQPAVPTTAGSGLVFTTQQVNTAASTCHSRVSAAVATATSSGTISIAATASASQHWGFGVWVFRGSAGIGNSTEQHTSTKTVTFTPTAADGAIVYATFDFQPGTLQTATPTPTDTRQAVADGTSYTLYVDDITDQTSAAGIAYGITGGSGTGPFSIVVQEIKASLHKRFVLTPQ